MSDSKSGEQAVVANAQPEAEATENKLPTKRTPKRKADAFQKESEELLKTLGVTVDMEDGRRRTRSSARGPGTPTAVTPATPPAKRARGGVPTNSAKRSKEEDVAEETTPNSKGTPKKGGHAAPKKIFDSAEQEPPNEKEDLAVPVADRTDASEASKDSTAGKEDVSKVTPPAVDDKDVKEVQADKSADEEVVKKDEADSAATVEETKEPAKMNDKEAEEPMDQQKSGEDAVEKPASATEEKKDTPVEESKPAAETPMEVDEQDGKSVASDEAKKSEVIAVDDASDAVESNGGEVKTIAEPVATPEKKEVPTVKEVHSEKETSHAVEATNSNEPEESSTIQESDKTATPSVTVNSVDSATENNVAEKVNSTVESKIVTNDSAAVEPATAP